MVNAYHYFFYGMASESELNSLIQEAEDVGCEFLQVMGVTVPLPKQSGLALPGKPVGPQNALVYRIFVRCHRNQTAEVDKKMKAYAEKEQAKGSRLNGVT
jgi:hypothetical protein